MDQRTTIVFNQLLFIYYDFVIAKQTLFNRNCNFTSCSIFYVKFILQFSHNLELSGIADFSTLNIKIFNISFLKQKLGHTWKEIE